MDIIQLKDKHEKFLENSYKIFKSYHDQVMCRFHVVLFMLVLSVTVLSWFIPENAIFAAGLLSLFGIVFQMYKSNFFEKKQKIKRSFFTKHKEEANKLVAELKTIFKENEKDFPENSKESLNLLLGNKLANTGSEIAIILCIFSQFGDKPFVKSDTI